MTNNDRRQGIFWIGTIPREQWTPFERLPEPLQYICGQLEEGESTGYKHYQIFFAFRQKQSLCGVKKLFPAAGHYELSRSSAAREYCLKDDTSVGGRFEYGVCPIQRNSKPDWERIWQHARRGEFELVPACIRIQSYGALRRIASDYRGVEPMDRRAYVYWGETSTGKSHRAWQEAGMDAYAKDPRTKFWDGYQSQKHVVCDEFRGVIDIANLLRWLDKYPVRVETKGSTVPLGATTFWFTSNVNPSSWYPDCDEHTISALMRRLEVIHFTLKINK